MRWRIVTGQYCIGKNWYWHMSNSTLRSVQSIRGPIRSHASLNIITVHTQNITCGKIINPSCIILRNWTYIQFAYYDILVGDSIYGGKPYWICPDDIVGHRFINIVYRL